MAKHILHIVEGAYRVTAEEQDDPAVWLAGAMQGNGGTVSILLRGNAVNYGVTRQDASGVKIGAWAQTQPPRVQDDLARLIGKGVDVFIVEDDVLERGLERGELISGLKPVARRGMAVLFAGFDLVWHW